MTSTDLVENIKYNEYRGCLKLGIKIESVVLSNERESQGGFFFGSGRGQHP